VTEQVRVSCVVEEGADGRAAQVAEHEDVRDEEQYREDPPPLMGEAKEQYRRDEEHGAIERSHRRGLPVTCVGSTDQTYWLDRRAVGIGLKNFDRDPGEEDCVPTELVDQRAFAARRPRMRPS